MGLLEGPKSVRRDYLLESLRLNLARGGAIADEVFDGNLAQVKRWAELAEGELITALDEAQRQDLERYNQAAKKVPAEVEAMEAA